MKKLPFEAHSQTRYRLEKGLLHQTGPKLSRLGPNFVNTTLNTLPLKKCYGGLTQLTFTCLKSTIETLEKGVKYIQG